MSTNHYRTFVEIVDRGMFDNENIGPYLRDIINRTRYLQSPIKAHETREAFGISEEEFWGVINSFLERALMRKKALPLDELVCVEDDFSAVFVENDPEKERTIRVTTFKDMKEYGESFNGTLSFGLLQLRGYEGKFNIFSYSDVYATFVFRDHHEPIEDPKHLDLVAHDLVKSADTVIEQLVYMEREGLLKEVRMLN